MSTVILHNISIKLACCHLIAMTDMSGILRHEGKLRFINNNSCAAKLPNPRADDSGLDSVKVNFSHINMMTKAINILKHKKIDPNEYRLALAHARTLPDSERIGIAMSSEFFTEMVPEEALTAIIYCVNME